MANEIKITQDDRYAAGIFFYSALPLLRVIVESEPKFAAKFKGKSFVFQVSAACEGEPGGKMATHFVIEDGVFTVKVGKAHESPDLEFAFPDLRKFAIFFSGKGMPFPKIKGMSKLGYLIPILMTLLRMAALLQATDAPKKESDKELLVKLYFYLLPNGISRLNKMGHPEIKNFTQTSPDRAFAWSVKDKPELNSYIRVKAGNSKAGRGVYKRCKPFLTMNFDNAQHALDILMSKADMIEYIKKGFLFIDGAPEFGAALGNLMMTVAYYAQGQYIEG